ncbi:hypothetical protein BDAP_000977 [Binucleata daphniae]
MIMLCYATGDIEQLNSYDKLILKEDESSFTTIPSGQPNHYYFPLHHIREGMYCHGNHYDNERNYDNNNYFGGAAADQFIDDISNEYHKITDCPNNSRCKLHHHSHAHRKSHRRHVKDSFGHHYYDKHYSNRTNISPMKDVYVPINSYHYKAFPFKDTILYGNMNQTESNDTDNEENENEIAKFH